MLGLFGVFIVGVEREVVCTLIFVFFDFYFGLECLVCIFFVFRLDFTA